jgi:hypothetical protein
MMPPHLKHREIFYDQFVKGEKEHKCLLDAQGQMMKSL